MPDGTQEQPARPENTTVRSNRWLDKVKRTTESLGITSVGELITGLSTWGIHTGVTTLNAPILLAGLAASAVGTGIEWVTGARYTKTPEKATFLGIKALYRISAFVNPALTAISAGFSFASGLLAQRKRPGKYNFL